MGALEKVILTENMPSMQEALSIQTRIFLGLSYGPGLTEKIA